MTDLQKLLAFALRRRGLDVCGISWRLRVDSREVARLLNERPVPEVSVPRDQSPANIERLTQSTMDGALEELVSEVDEQFSHGDRVQYSDEGAECLRPKSRDRIGLVTSKRHIAEGLVSVRWAGTKTSQRLYSGFLKLAYRSE